MESAFDKCQVIGSSGIRDLMPLLNMPGMEGRFELDGNDGLTLSLQRSVGDILVQDHKKRLIAIEIKTEQENKHNNFFLETWSNMKTFRSGWMLNLSHTDVLWYYFQREKELYTMSFRRLRHWAFTEQKIYRWPERDQRQSAQHNLTRGRCVPIETLLAELAPHIRVIVDPLSQGDLTQGELFPLRDQRNHATVPPQKERPGDYPDQIDFTRGG